MLDAQSSVLIDSGPDRHLRRWGSAVVLVASLVAVLAGRAIAQLPAVCIGDCNGDGAVAINELILGVNIALNMLDISDCPNLDNGQGTVTVDRLIAAVNSALCDCGVCPTPAPDTPTPTATGESVTPSVTPTSGASVSMWTVDNYEVTSSDCAGAIEDAVLSGLQAAGSDFTVRQSGEQVEIEDGEGNVLEGTADPDGTVHVQRTLSGSMGPCDYEVDVDASANLSNSPTTATYDGIVNLSGFCLNLSDCSLQITSRWTRLEGAASRNQGRLVDSTTTGRRFDQDRGARRQELRANSTAELCRIVPCRKAAAKTAALTVCPS